MKLSKVDFLTWRNCRHDAWLKVNTPEVCSAAPPSAFDQTLVEAGREVNVLARELFPDGVEIARGDFTDTQHHVNNRTPVLYQPVFATELLTTACDILVWNGERYDLYEVKASTGGDGRNNNDDQYAYDLGFQAHLLRELGVPIGRLHLVRLNGGYVRSGALELDRLFVCDDLTDHVAAYQLRIAVKVLQAHADLNQAAPLPGPCGCILKGRSSHCATFEHSNPEVPEYSVHDIARIGLSPKKLASMVARGILAVTDVPDGERLSAIQSNQVAVSKAQQAMVDRRKIAKFLGGIEEPISFLDYETFPAAVPRFDGYRPFDQIPFQFSLHVVEDRTITHHEFLFTESSNPDTAVIGALNDCLPGKGSIVVWSASFETTINRRLAERNPSASAMMADIKSRVIDLEVPFKQQMLVHPVFRGRTSIKAVLPVLVPELTYENLSIREGATASATWNAIVSGALDAATNEQKRCDLLSYCALDTKAMVAIWGALYAFVADQPR